ncbi:hypothetical protein H8356DRAFT_1038324 [Neocallimastix lanati (nom. inval.)]|nr:hypothetical protein H8356DRAFT_1038324 [Neocallimastix sp. JGI-2020a]
MWILEDLKKKNYIWLKPGLTITIGRKDCDVLILNDRSVSRQHAKIFVEKAGITKTNDPDYKPQVILKDLDSKFGTSVNSERINGSIILSDDNDIKFGAFSEYRLKYIPIIICFSSLSSVEKAELTALAVKNGVTLTKSWTSNCTHLIMNKIKVTQKVILALVYNKEIVNMKWLEDFENCNFKDFRIPNESNFFPTIGKNEVFEKLTPEVFKPNDKRKNLYSGITFIIFSLNQYNKLASIIKAANGSIVSLYDKIKENKIKNISDLISIIKRYNNTCMVEPSNDINTEMKQIIIDTAKFLNQRLIDDSEIGFSVIYASTEVFTNKDILLVDNQKIKIKETQYLPTLANNSLIFNPNSNMFSKSSYFSINQNLNLNDKDNVNSINDNKQNIKQSTDIPTTSNKSIEDDTDLTTKHNISTNYDNSFDNNLFDDKFFSQLISPTKKSNDDTTIKKDIDDNIKINKNDNGNNNKDNNINNNNGNENDTNINNNDGNENDNDINNNDGNNNDDNDNFKYKNNNNIKNNEESVISTNEKKSPMENITKFDVKENSNKSEKSQNISLFWDNLLDITSDDENNEDNKSEFNKDNRNENSEDNKSEDIKENIKEKIIISNSNNDNKNNVNKVNISNNKKNDNKVNITNSKYNENGLSKIESFNKISNNSLNNSIDNIIINKSSINSNDNFLFSSTNFNSEDENESSEILNKVNNINNSNNDNENGNKKGNLNNNDNDHNDNDNNSFSIEGNDNEVTDIPFFYKYDIFMNNNNNSNNNDDNNLNINNNNVIEDTGKSVQESNKKRDINTAFDDDDDENNDEINKVIQNARNDLQMINELEIEAVVSFSDNLIPNKNINLKSNKSNDNQNGGINFKKFKKSKFIKSNDTIYRDSLFYYEANKISEEWLMGNEINEQEKLTSEAILVKTNTLTSSRKDGDIISMLSHNTNKDSNNNNNNIDDDSMLVVDDNENIYLSEKDVDKRKLNKKSNKKQIPNEFIISDSDDESDDDKFIWN